ncbi:MAG: prephenate dehydrogenase/arogenate dehydrogenase family protein [Caldisericaceae bacterium]|nr:prephenate dehydrogenase/arogenate dehydrogenase family protein [Caldisericaceae bacterium]
MNIGIIGAGKVGITLAIAFKKAGFNVFIASRSIHSAEKAAAISGGISTSIQRCAEQSDVIFLSVPDSEIENVAKNLKNIVSKEKIVAHLSGAFPSSILEFLNAKTCSVHPLKSFADPLFSAKTLPETLFAIEGDEAAVNEIEKIIQKINGTLIRIKTIDKPIYHLAATITANYTVTLFNLSENLLCSIGFNETEAKNVLLSLLQGVLNNIKEKGSTQALTGPILRGDIKTIQLHLKNINDPSLKNVYKNLAFATLKIAERRGLNKEKIEEMRKVLNDG